MTWAAAAELRPRGKRQAHAFPQAQTSWNVVERLLLSRRLRQSGPAKRVAYGHYVLPVEDMATGEARGERTAVLKNRKWTVTK